MRAPGDQPAAHERQYRIRSEFTMRRTRMNLVTLGTPPRSRTVTRRASHGSRSSARSIVPARRRLAGDDREVFLVDAVGM